MEHALQTLQLMADVALGMAHLHQNMLVHRDLAPRNVLVDQSELPRVRGMVNDFGLARKVTAANDSLGAAEHELDYDKIYFRQAPENFEMRQTHSFASDVFMLGASLWECIANLWK